MVSITSVTNFFILLVTFSIKSGNCQNNLFFRPNLNNAEALARLNIELSKFNQRSVQRQDALPSGQQDQPAQPKQTEQSEQSGQQMQQAQQTGQPGQQGQPPGQQQQQNQPTQQDNPPKISSGGEGFEGNQTQNSQPPNAKPPEANEASSQPKNPEQNRSEKMYELERLVQELYVAQAQVQLEANEIQRCQAIAVAAQQGLEEAANNVKMITAALHAAQQTVAVTAIRAQTAQLQLSAHDQLLFAARQKVDALSGQIVSVQAEEGIAPTKMVVDLQCLLDKLKEPLPDDEKPTPIPSILAGIESTKPNSSVSDGKTIHSVPNNFNNYNNYNGLRNALRKRQNDIQFLNSKLQGNDLINSENSLLQDNSEAPLDNSIDHKKAAEELKKQLLGMDGMDVKNLIRFAVAMRHNQAPKSSRTEQDRSNIQKLGDSILEKVTNQSYINQFLESLKNSILEKAINENYKKSALQEAYLSAYKKLKASGFNGNFGNYQNEKDDHIFNVENALDLNLENFREILP